MKPKSMVKKIWLLSILSIFLLSPVIAFADAPPTLAPIGNKSVNEGVLLSFNTTATGKNPPFTFSATGLPSGASFTNNGGNPGSGTFSWTPTNSQAGSYPNVYFKVTDSGSPKKSADEYITITVVDVTTPVLASIGDKSVSENATLSFTLSATDPDGDTLTYSIYSATPAITGASIIASTGAFSWKPTYDQAGTYSVTFRATDPGSLYDSKTITITVNNVNRAPSLTSPGDKSVDEGATLSFTLLSATDPDVGDTLTYSASNLPSGAIFTPATRTFSWAPNYTQAGTYPNVRFTVTDNGSPNMSDYKQITITVNNVNRAPVLDPIVEGGKVGELLQFVITATDPDGDPLTYSYTATPPTTGATITDNGSPDYTGTFSWTPGDDQAGPYSVTFTVTDNGLLSDSKTITIIIDEKQTLIELSSFAAYPFDGSVLIEWITEAEIDNVGFNLYRAESKNGVYIRLNSALIIAEGSSVEGADYVFVDEDVQNRKTYYYTLEDIDLYGVSTFHGSVSVAPRKIYGGR
jgi:hypothetical protein